MRLIPVIQPDSNKIRAAYQLAGDIVEEVGGQLVRVPSGFQYDGASIPRLLWPLIGSPFDPRYMRAAVVHDWLYHVHLVNRDAADAALARILIEDGTAAALAHTMRAGVRLFGWRYWTNDAADADYMWRLRYSLIADHRNPADYGLGAL